MSSITAQQAKLDLELVPKEKRFRMDKKKKFYINLETSRDIFQICPRVPGQDFYELPTDEDIVSFFKELGVTPPKKERKFKKPASPKLTNVPVSPEEPIRKSKRVKRPVKKSTNAPTTCVVIRDNPVILLSKKKKKVTVEKRKGIELLSEGRDKDDSNNDHDASSEGSDQESDSGNDNTQSDNEKGSDFEHETDKNETGSKSDQEENEDDEEEKEDEFVKTPSNYTPTDDEDETNVESNVEDNAEGDEDKGMDYATNQFDDDVDIRLNDPVNTDEGLIQKEGTNTEMINTEVPVTSSSHSSDLASKFLDFADIPLTDAEIVSPLDVHVHHNDDLLNTQVTALVDEHLDSRLAAARDEFMSYFSASITARIIEQVKIQLPQILQKEVSNFDSLMNKSMVTKSLEHAVLANEECYDGLLKSYELDKSLFSTYDKVYSLKRSREDKDKDKDPFAGSNRGLKKKKKSKDVEPTKDFDMPHNQEGNLGNHDEEIMGEARLHNKATQSLLMTLTATADKPLKTFYELMSTPIDLSTYFINGLKITNLTQETLLGPAFKLLKGTRTNFVEMEYDFEQCYKSLSEKLDWDNPDGGLEGCASWDGGKGTWGGRERSFGTVPVLAGEGSDLKDSIDQTDLANLYDYFVDPTPKMFDDEHAPDYSFPPRFDVYPDDFLEIESDADNFYDDPFDSKGEKIKEIFPSPDNEDKVFNPGILIQEKYVTIITRVAQEKKLAISYASLVFEDFDPPFYDPLVFKDVPNSMRLLLFSSKNEEKVFKPGIYTSEKVKERQENDKIRSKPDKNGKHGKARKSQKPITVKKEEKNEENTSQGTKYANSYKIVLLEEKGRD
nr:hypothetical protein [Tanacetum cinerariifolium]